MNTGEPLFDELLSLLTPHDIQGLSKKRLGEKRDGGYIIPKELMYHCTDLITYGVGDDTAFEKDLTSQYEDINCYLFDHTIPDIALQPKWFFKKEGLGVIESLEHNTFQNHVIAYGLDRANLLLKIDIEGSEWFAIPTLNLCNVVVFILEIHFLGNKHQWQRYIECLRHIAQTMVLFHSHGNNYGGLFTNASIALPNTLELTYVHKKHAKNFSRSNELFPIEGIDYPNDPAKPDYRLNYWQKISV